MDRLQATATTLRGEFLFKSLLTLFHPSGADLPPLRANAHTRKKSMGGNSDNFCMFLNVYQVRYKPFFMVKKLTIWSGDH